MNIFCKSINKCIALILVCLLLCSEISHNAKSVIFENYMYVYTTLLSVIDLGNKTLKLRYWKLQITLCTHSSAIHVQSVNKIWTQKHFPQAAHFITFIREEERASQFGIFRSNRKKYVRLTVRHIDNFFPETIHLQICNLKILTDIDRY